MNYTETGCGGLDWIQLALETVQWVELCEHGDDHSGSIKIETFLII
jgi:hypothetical protein